MKCKACSNEIEDCSFCGTKFEAGNKIVCVDESIHLCGDECLDDWFFDVHAVEDTEVEE